jgi:hypothetical protein
MIIVRRVINRRANFNLDDDLRDAFDKANRKYRNPTNLLNLILVL